MLPRSLHSLYEHLRDYVVAEENGVVVGCTGLHIMWDDLAEIRSLAVDEAHSGRGVGSALVRWALSDAEAFRVGSVFVLTFVPHFFAKMGFRCVEKSELPHKIWQECIHCVHFPDCNEVALVTDLPQRG
jgi:amino-acid N-acetyltransferase